MAPTITASPNPVTFSLYFTGANKNTTITWDAGGNTKGRVFVSVNGGPETLFDGNPQGGNGQGAKVASVQFGQTLEFRLRQSNAANTLLASVKVTTEKELLTLPGAAIEALKRTDLQHIYDLEVSPGIDNVTITFRTRQPTNPQVYITNTQTGDLDGLWARQEKKQDHSIVFEGGSDGLAQNTLFNYRIIAQAMPGSIGPSKVEATGTFRTGLRTATVFFDQIFMRLDGDGDTPGEFTFSFGVGDVNTHGLLGEPQFYGDETSITDRHTEQVDKVFTIPTAPRRLWAQVNALEDDDYYNPFDAGFHGHGIGASFEWPGTHGWEDEYYAFASVTEHFDIGGPLRRPSDRPFTMSTGLFAIAYNVLGRLRVKASNGEWLTRLPNVTHSLRRPEGFRERAARPIWSAHPGQSAVVAAVHGHPHRVLLDLDGAVYHQALGEDPRAWRDARWTSLGGQFEGPLTVVAVGADRIGLFGLSPEGAVTYKTHAEDGGRPDHGWHTLGGDFVGPVVAATGADGRIELFATSEDGSVFHRALAHPQRSQSRGEWEHVGSGIGDSIAVLFSPRSGLSLFALGHGGEVLHKRRPPKEEWHPAGREWETLGVASEGLLSAEWVGDEGLLLAVVAEDETVRVLAWSAYPEAPPSEGWQIAGTVNSLLQGQIPAGEATPVPNGPGGYGGSSRQEPSNQEISQMP
jgi:hypothetical protein